MWGRDLFFGASILGGLTALVFQLVPATRSRPLPAPTSKSSTVDAATVRRVDAFFRQQWAESELTPAARAPEELVARRLSLGLTGTIPSLEEMRQWQQLSPGQLLDSWLTYLLQDRRYADYVAERLARATVGSEGGPFIVYRRRRFVSWLSDQLLANRPYDQIVRDMLTAQGLWTDQPATNFVTVTIDLDNQKGPNPDRLAGRVTRAFLGIRLDCAQCHNHPFQSWKQADFHGLSAFFGQVKNGFTGIYDDLAGVYQIEDRKTGKLHRIEPRVPFLPEALPAEGTSRQRLADWITDRRNQFFARAVVNRFWALLFGRPLVEPVDDLAASESVPPVLDALAEDFIAGGYDLHRLIRTLAATEVFRLDSATDHEAGEVHEKAWAVFPLTRLRPEQVVGSILQASQLETVNRDSHILTRFFRAIGENDFVQRYGDTGDDDFEDRGGTIPQRLLLMNGQIVHERTKEGLFNAATRIGWMAPSDAAAVEIAYRVVLTRSPTAEELDHFCRRLEGSTGDERSRRMEDLFWSLINSTEFSWNH